MDNKEVSAAVIKAIHDDLGGSGYPHRQLVKTRDACIYNYSIGGSVDTYYYRINLRDGIHLTRITEREMREAISEENQVWKEKRNKEYEQYQKEHGEAERKARAEQQRMTREGDIAGLLGINDPKRKAALNKDPFGQDVRNRVKEICSDITRKQMAQGNTENICTMAFPVRVLGNNNYLAQMQIGRNSVSIRFDMSGNYEEVN